MLTGFNTGFVFLLLITSLRSGELQAQVQAQSDASASTNCQTTAQPGKISSLARAVGTALTGGKQDESKLQAKVLSFDPSDPKACESFHQALADSGLSISKDDDTLKPIEAAVCSPGTNRQPIRLVIAAPADPSDGPHPDHWTSNVSLALDQTTGNQETKHVDLQFAVKKIWTGKQVFRLDITRHTEQENALSNYMIQPDYDHDINKHVAWFVIGQIRHDTEKSIDRQTEIYGGLMKNYYEFGDKDGRVLSASAGIGERNGKFTDGTRLKETVSSYRLRESRPLTSMWRADATLLAQHVLFAPGSEDHSRQIMDLKDNRVVSDVKLTFAPPGSRGVNFSVGHHAERWNRPPLAGQKKLDQGINAAIGFGW